jgi:hypothetical protein
LSPDNDIEQRFEIAVRLALGASRRPASPDCLTPEVIAAYYVYALNRIERSRCQAHISECRRCQETLDALFHAKPEDQISPESAARVAEAELVGPGSPPPWRLKPAAPPAFEFGRIWRIAGLAIAFVAIVAVVILADVHLRRGMETGDDARVAAVQATAQRRARHRRPALAAPQNDELALNEVNPEPAAPASAPAAPLEPAVPTTSASSAAAHSAPGNIYSNPLFQGAPRTGSAQGLHSHVAGEAPAQANAQSTNGKRQTAASVPVQSAPAASSPVAAPAVKQPESVASTNTSTVTTPSATALLVKRAEPSAASAPPAVPAAPVTAAASAGATTPAKVAGAESASDAKAASAPKTKTSEIASEPPNTFAPRAARKLAAQESQASKLASRELASKRAERLAELKRRRIEAIAKARARREARMRRAEHARLLARERSTEARQVSRLADNRQPGAADVHANLVVANVPAPTSILPAVAPVAAGIPVPPRSALVASPHASVYWSFQDFGIIYRSTDRRSWVRLPSGTRDDLLAGAAPSRMVCWAVGQRGTILLTKDGTHWTRIKSPTTADLVGVIAASADVATVIARNGQHFSTFDGGSNWQPGKGEASFWQRFE